MRLPKRPKKAFQSISERTNKMWFIHKVEYDLALKRVSFYTKPCVRRDSDTIYNMDEP